MEGPTLEALRPLAVMQLVIPLSESRVDAEADNKEMVGAALAYCKHDRFNKAAYVRISMKRQPGIDTGEFADNFFAIVFSEIALSRSVQRQLSGFTPPLRQAICLQNCYPLLAQ